MRASKPKLDPEPMEVLLADQTSNAGSDIILTLLAVELPVKAYVFTIWGCAWPQHCIWISTVGNLVAVP